MDAVPLWGLPLLTVIGVLAGWLNVMAGGGSLLTIPAMLFLGLPGPVANGSNRIAILAQNIVAFSTFVRSGVKELRLTLSLGLMALIGALIGAQIGVRLDGVWFNRVLAVIMAAVLASMLWPGKKAAKDSSHPGTQRPILGHILMVGVGAWGGFIQIAVGFLLMPVLHRVMGLPLVTVNMHKVGIVLVYTIGALAVFAAQVELAWAAGLALALGNAVGGWLGAKLSIKGGEIWIKRVFTLAVIGLIVRLLFFS